MTHPNDDPGRPMTDAFLRSCTDDQLVTLIRRTVDNPDTLQDVADEVAVRFGDRARSYTLCDAVPPNAVNTLPCDRVAGHEGRHVLRWRRTPNGPRVTEHELTD